MKALRAQPASSLSIPMEIRFSSINMCERFSWATIVCH